MVNINQLTDVEVLYIVEKFVRKQALKWCKGSLESLDGQRWLVGQSQGKMYAFTGTRLSSSLRHRRPFDLFAKYADDTEGGRRRLTGGIYYLRERHPTADEGTIIEQSIDKQRAFLDIVNQHVPHKISSLFKIEDIRDIAQQIEEEVITKQLENQYYKVFKFTSSSLEAIRDCSLNIIVEDLKEQIKERIGTSKKITISTELDEDCPLLAKDAVEDRTGHTLFEALKQYDLDKILSGLSVATWKGRWSSEERPLLEAHRFAIIHGSMEDRAVGMISDSTEIREAVDLRNKVETSEAIEFFKNLSYKYPYFRDRAMSLCKIGEADEA